LVAGFFADGLVSSLFGWSFSDEQLLESGSIFFEVLLSLFSDEVTRA
jgi:hypothetical protein